MSTTETDDKLHGLLCNATDGLKPIRDLLEESLEAAPQDRMIVAKLNAVILDLMESRALRAKEKEAGEARQEAGGAG